MNKLHDREYRINIDPRILELLGPSLYTNIYYVLAELIANAYDANASNVYIIEKEGCIIVEDDGVGMSYEKGDIKKYLNVAVETRTTKEDVYVEGASRKRIGRKGIGKLAALSVSERVLVSTKKNEDKSGFVLSRHVGSDQKLEPLEEKDIKFEYIPDESSGTSVVMTNPQYGLHKTATAIKKNLLKLFPLITSDFKIHIITDQAKILIDSFDKEMIEGLGALIILGEEYHYLSEYFDCYLPDNDKIEKELLKKKETVTFHLILKNKEGKEKNYDLQIKGWIGAYRSTRGRKDDSTDFPDNFVSLLSNGKLGEYNVLPIAGKNKLHEVYIVGQLHVDLFEETELPDMALSNRQGYKTDDPRYVNVIQYVRNDLLPRIVNMRVLFAGYQKDEKDKEKFERQKKDEEELRKKVDEYKTAASGRATEKIADKLRDEMPEGIKEIIENEMNEVLPIVGVKKKVDSQKKRILISHTRGDKTLVDAIYKMLSFNGVPDVDIIYTNCDNEDCRIPNRMNLFEYLRTFFVDSYSNEKMFVIYVTSDDMARAWGAVSEVGAGWITQSNHDIFNIDGHEPQPPLNVAAEWQTSRIVGDNISMDSVEFDKFIVKVIDICNHLGYHPKSKEDNKKELHRYVSIN
ncbi:hypothetical protein C5S29_13475 [ANME-1 cluster archaeon GoMg3.2]|nr:hypothetical protein [ANME-1 cluster archaeon GoMg3.2]